MDAREPVMQQSLGGPSITLKRHPVSLAIAVLGAVLWALAATYWIFWRRSFSWSEWLFVGCGLLLMLLAMLYGDLRYEISPERIRVHRLVGTSEYELPHVVRVSRSRYGELVIASENGSIILRIGRDFARRGCEDRLRNLFGERLVLAPARVQ